MLKNPAAISVLCMAVLLGSCEAQDEPAASSGTSEEVPSTAAEAGAKTNPEFPMDEASPNLNTQEPDASECGADQLDRWLNAMPTDTVKEEIAEAAGHDRIRYIAPGDVVTMDFRPERLNVETGDDGRIRLFRCG